MVQQSSDSRDANKEQLDRTSAPSPNNDSGAKGLVYPDRSSATKDSSYEDCAESQYTSSDVAQIRAVQAAIQELEPAWRGVFPGPLGNKTESKLWSIQRETGHYLRDAIIKDARSRILELGTSAGFSTLFLAEGVMRTGGKIVTIELDPEKHHLAHLHFEQAKVDRLIELIPGDIIRVLHEKHLAGETYDFIFIDADKAQYESYLELSSRLLTQGGTIIADNVTSHSHHLAQFMTSALTRQEFKADLVEIGSGLLRLDHIVENLHGNSEE